MAVVPNLANDRGDWPSHQTWWRATHGTVGSVYVNSLPFLDIGMVLIIWISLFACGWGIGKSAKQKWTVPCTSGKAWQKGNPSVTLKIWRNTAVQTQWDFFDVGSVLD